MVGTLGEAGCAGEAGGLPGGPQAPGGTVCCPLLWLFIHSAVQMALCANDMGTVSAHLSPQLHPISTGGRAAVSPQIPPEGPSQWSQAGDVLLQQYLTGK